MKPRSKGHLFFLAASLAFLVLIHSGTASSGDLCDLLSLEEVQAITGMPIIRKAVTTQYGPGRCTFYAKSTYDPKSGHTFTVTTPDGKTKEVAPPSENEALSFYPSTYDLNQEKKDMERWAREFASEQALSYDPNWLKKIEGLGGEAYYMSTLRAPKAVFAAAKVIWINGPATYVVSLDQAAKEKVGDDDAKLIPVLTALAQTINKKLAGHPALTPPVQVAKTLCDLLTPDEVQKITGIKVTRTALQESGCYFYTDLGEKKGGLFSMGGEQIVVSLGPGPPSAAGVEAGKKAAEEQIASTKQQTGVDLGITIEFIPGVGERALYSGIGQLVWATKGRGFQLLLGAGYQLQKGGRADTMKSPLIQLAQAVNKKL